MDKKALSERDICTKFITPAVKKAGWDEMTQIREEVSFTKGRIIVRGKPKASRAKPQSPARRSAGARAPAKSDAALMVAEDPPFPAPVNGPQCGNGDYRTLICRSPKWR